MTPTRTRGDLQAALASAPAELQAFAAAIGETPGWVEQVLLNAMRPGPAARAGVRPATARDLRAGAAAVAKERPVRSKTHLQRVAALCCSHCRTEGVSQAAHPNRGKGLSLKTDDRLAFPLCSAAGNGCHEAFDQYRLFASREAHARAGLQWTQQTITDLHRQGRWLPELAIPPGFTID